MRTRTIALVVAILLVAGFAALNWAEVVRPAPLLFGPIVADAPANLVVLDPGSLWTVEVEALQSRSRNSPFLGRELTGRPTHVLLRGRFTFKDGQPWPLEGTLEAHQGAGA